MGRGRGVGGGVEDSPERQEDRRETRPGRGASRREWAAISKTTERKRLST